MDYASAGRCRTNDSDFIDAKYFEGIQKRDL
jgi:hypothetical protein